MTPVYTDARGFTRYLDRMAREYVRVPERAQEPRGTLVAYREGVLGQHVGDGWLLVYGEGVNYPCR